ncbi:RCC1 domain-containing protein [Polyangium jinanense]|uniref:Chromosome condensation regulator RCC1 n=1 Tax=Polyangium jinanense TaxID=2829994 RepID=A0A9X4AST8_9BACT|nr:chromosome condensation regulator RCC1 [Polyangium jinanense]MDC3961087.1 chromosome condensation regulator RCC1 [Polyangium jinanense]MDC3982836.1 chromosome condensation regulator RCC1 [Polyangium jinanense]
MKRTIFWPWALAPALVLCAGAGCSDEGEVTPGSGGNTGASTTTSGSGGQGGSGGAGGSAASGSGGTGNTGGEGGGGTGGTGGSGGAGGAGGAGGEGGASSDSTPPVVTLGGISSGALLRTARILVSVHAEDSGGLAKVEFTLNGAPVTALPVDSGAPMFDGFVDARPTRGKNTLVVAAEDLAGHRTEVPLDVMFERKAGAGGSHTGAISSGKVAVWGRNNLGQLGLGVGETTSRLEPVLVPDIEEITALDFRQNQSLALRKDGALFVWGNNADGRLGLAAPGMSDADKREVPTQNTNLSGVLAATFGYDHTLVLLEDGTVRAFGDNASGQLGDGTTEDRHSPVAIAGLDDIIQVVGGSKHSLALRRDGTVWAWGRNQFGNLGQGTADADPHPTPVQVPALADVVHLASGRDHVLALRSDGTIVAWGLNQNGQVGNGMSGADAEAHSPTAVVGLAEAAAVFADGNFSFAIRANGSAVGWGQNFNGQLGIGGDDTVDRNAPDTPLALPAVLDIEPGATHVIGTAPDGTVYTWGWSTNGSLGRPNLLNNWAYPTPGLVTLP